MTDTDIIQLARMYRAQANYPYEDPTEAKLAAMDVIKFILKDHCIVKRKKNTSQDDEEGYIIRLR